jgi:hypothetical protein
MQIARKYVCTGLATLIIAGVAVQSFGTAQAERMGYVQADCPTIVQNAINTIGSACTKIGRNSLCYGNSTIQAQFQPGAGNPSFQKSGDVVDVSQVKQFTLGGMDAVGNWGMAEMKIQADLPNTDPTKAVTFIFFGNVQLTDAVSDANATAIALSPTALPAQQTQVAVATNQQATKVAATATKLAGIENTATARALTPTPTGTILAAKATQVAATATKLASLIGTATAARSGAQPGAAEGLYSGLQAFYFQSKDSAPCDQAPHDGVLIQSPKGFQRVTLSIDGATVSLGSTIYVTAQPSGFLTVNTLQGSAQVTVAGQSQTAGVGLAVQVPLDANLHASGPPQLGQLYGADTIRALPVQILPIRITPAAGLPSGVLMSQWQIRFDQPVGLGPSCTTMPSQQTVIDSLAIASNTIWWNRRAYVMVLWRFGATTNPFTGLYTVQDANGIVQTTDTLQLLSPTHIDGQEVEQFTQFPSCNGWSYHVQMDRVDSLTPTP